MVNASIIQESSNEVIASQTDSIIFIFNGSRFQVLLVYFLVLVLHINVPYFCRCATSVAEIVLEL